ncbi:MAG: metallophosphoesterase, partial [Candidatus Aminicenantes bacterium]|nr:metallophosphoesterase [Candidatus Aminicenantes bacterium]
MRILFLGDIIGRPGRRVIGRHLPPILRHYSPTLIIANAENAAGGIGLTEP